MTPAQRRALAELLPRYTAAGAGILDLERLFGRRAPRYVEVGFGAGEALVAMARAHPERDYLGIEVYEPGVGRVLMQLEALGLGNVRVLVDDAVRVLEERLPPSSLDGVLVFFPDPWPKKRHHKRRLVQSGFVARVREALKPGGRVHLATDWAEYAEHMLAVAEADPGLVNVWGPGRFAPGRGERPPTRFEARGARLGHPVWDLVLERAR